MKYLALFIFLLLSSPAFSLHPDEVLQDEQLEARARHMTAQLRCLVCRGEAIDESNAALAADLRRLVRARLVEGDSDEQVLAYVRARYGDVILMDPPFQPSTFLLWLSPFAVLICGGVMIWRLVRKGRP